MGPELRQTVGISDPPNRYIAGLCPVFLISWVWRVFMRWRLYMVTGFLGERWSEHFTQINTDGYGVCSILFYETVVNLPRWWFEWKSDDLAWLCTTSNQRGGEQNKSLEFVYEFKKRGACYLVWCSWLVVSAQDIVLNLLKEKNPLHMDCTYGCVPKLQVLTYNNTFAMSPPSRQQAFAW